MRRALAGVARRPEMAGVLDQVNTATVGGAPVDGALLGGWLGDRMPGAGIDQDPDRERASLNLSGPGVSVEVACQ